MGEATKIEWCDHTFNPWIGCTRVSPGCMHCYAETQNAFRMWNGGKWGPGALRKVTAESNWNQVRKWNRAAARDGVRRRVFCASLADVFDDEAPALAQVELWQLIRECDALDWLLLTKRPQNWMRMLPADWLEQWPAQVRLGFTAEDQEWFDKRLEHVIAMRRMFVVPKVFVSYEPATGELFPCGRALQHIGWVICGGESGPGARPMHPAWARMMRDRCRLAGVPFFFKQWGEWAPDHDADIDYPTRRIDLAGRAVTGCIGLHCDTDAEMYRVGKRAAGAYLDWRMWREFPGVQA